MIKKFSLAALFFGLTLSCADLNAQISDAKPTALKLGQAKKAKKLSDFVESGVDFDKKACAITNYTMYVQRPSFDPSEYEISSDELPKKVMSNLKKGDRLVFINVKGKCTGDSAKRQMPDIVIEVQ